MAETIVLLNDISEEELIKNDNQVILQWTELYNEIKRLIRLREDENIEGYVVTNKIINVKISRKKGRKKSKA